MNLAPEFVKNVKMIEVSLSLLGQEVKIISPKNRLHSDMKRTIKIDLICFEPLTLTLKKRRRIRLTSLISDQGGTLLNLTKLKKKRNRTATASNRFIAFSGI